MKRRTVVVVADAHVNAMQGECSEAFEVAAVGSEEERSGSAAGGMDLLETRVDLAVIPGEAVVVVEVEGVHQLLAEVHAFDGVADGVEERRPKAQAHDVGHHKKDVSRD